jgi:hypothetical protein
VTLWQLLVVTQRNDPWRRIDGIVAGPPLRIGDRYRLGSLSPLAGLIAEIASLPDPHGKLTAFVRLFGAETLVKLRIEDLDEIAPGD